MVNDNTGWLYLKYITNNESMNQGYPEKEMPSSVLGSQGRHPFHFSSDILKMLMCTQFGKKKNVLDTGVLLYGLFLKIKILYLSSRKQEHLIDDLLKIATRSQVSVMCGR